MYPAAVDWAGYVWIFAILFALASTLWRASWLGLDSRVAFQAGLIAIVAGTLGGRLWMVLFDNQAHGLLDALDILRGEKSIMGAAVAAASGSWVALKLMRQPISAYLNAAVPMCFLAYSIGRIGCLIAGCCYGTPTSIPWAIAYPHGSEPFLAQQAAGLIELDAQHSHAVHPIPIYHAIFGIALAAMTWKGNGKTGWATAAALSGYGIARFGLEFFRGDAVPPILGSLNANHFAALAMLSIGIGLWRQRIASIVIAGDRQSA